MRWSIRVVALLLCCGGLCVSQREAPEKVADIGGEGDEAFVGEGFYGREGPYDWSKVDIAREHSFRWAGNEFALIVPAFPGQFNEVVFRMRFSGLLRLEGEAGWSRELLGHGAGKATYTVVLTPEEVGDEERVTISGTALTPVRASATDQRTLFILLAEVRVRSHDEDPGTGERELRPLMTDGPPIPVRDRLRGVEWRPATHDVSAFVARLHAEGANQVTLGALNGLGYAFFPSEHAAHHPNMDPKWLPGITKALREEGLGILCWVPFNVQDLKKIEDFQMARLHPEWRMRFIEDPERDYPPRTGMCVISSPYIEWYAQVLREVAAFDLDGIFFDGFYLGGIPHPSQPGCVCRWCEEAFRDDTGLDLPPQVDWSDMTFKRWVRWRNERLLKTARFFRDEMRQVNPKLEVTINFNLWPFAMKDWETGIPMWRVEDLGCSQHAYTFDPAQEWMMLGFKARLGRDINPNLNDIWRFSALPRGKEPTPEELARHELRLRTFLLAGLTYGIKPWYGGPAPTPTGRDAHEAVALRERYFARDEIQHVAVLCSQDTHDFHGHIPGTENLADYRDGLIGTWMLLTEAHIPFQFVFDNQMTAEALAPYKVLVLPNAAALSGEAIAVLQRWVRAGGSLVLTADTSAYDEWGELRDEAELADLWATEAGLGDGQATHIANDPGLAWVRSRNAGPGEALLSAVRQEPLPIEVDAPSTLVVNTFRSPDGSELWVHMLNVSAFVPGGDAGFRGLGKPPATTANQASDATLAEGEAGAYPPLVPVENVRVRVNAWEVGEARLVVADSRLEPDGDGWFTVSAVNDHETLVIGLR